MNVNLDELLGSTEFNFSNRLRPPRVLHRRCPECGDGEAFDITHRLCMICGEELVDIVEADHNHASSQRSSGDSMNFFDLLGDDLRRAIQESMAQSLPDRQISTEYLSKLGKVVLDSRRGLLYDVVVSIGPFSIMGVLAGFGPLPEKELISPIVFGVPEFGDGPLLANNSICSGAIVLLRRGKVSFAQKAITAKSSGAAALIICQTFDVWPFVMTDSANELSELNLDIPVIMISLGDSLILEKVLKSDAKKKSEDGHHKTGSDIDSTLSSISSKLICGRFEEECSICQENMLVGNSVLKLTCRHAYHTDCVQTWLERHNTCPLCRNEMPLHKGPKKRQPGAANDAPLDMPYFN